MAGKSNTTATLFAQKKLLNKAHTSILKSDAQETITTNIQPSAQTTFGQDIPAQPEKTLYLIQSASAGKPGTIEYVQFTVESISGTPYDADAIDSGAGPSPSNNGPHGYKLILTGNYETLSSNPKKGNGVFDEGIAVSDTLGQLQIIPPVFSNDRPNPYSVTLYKGTPGADPSTDPNIIALESEIDYQLDTFNGILFVQDYDSSTVPLYARAFIYVGDMISEVIEDINVSGGGSGDNNAEYMVTSLTGSLPNAKLIEAGPGITITTGSNSITISSDGSSGGGSITGRDKERYLLTSSHPANTEFITEFTDFSQVLFNPDLIDVFVNGVLMHSGSQSEVDVAAMDYTIATSGSINFAFDLFQDDFVDTILSKLSNEDAGGGGADPDASYLVLSTTGSLVNERALVAGNGIISTDAGPSSNFTLEIDDSIVATLTGAVFSGPVEFQGAVTGSFPVDRSKGIYFLSSNLPAGTSLATPSTDFSEAEYEQDKIDVFVNGVLLHSGSQSQISASERDYYIDSSSSLTFSFDMKVDDVIDIVVFKVT